MKNITILFILAVILGACSGEGTLEIINRTKHQIYINIEGNDYLLEGSEEPDENYKKFTISLDAGNDYFQQPEKSYLLGLIGETFAIYDYHQSIVVENTTITITGNKTTRIFCDPDYACLRITNNCQQDIISAFYKKSTINQPFLVNGYASIAPGSSIYQRLDYTPENPQSSEDIFYYTFQIILADSTTLNYGDEYNFLYNDDLYHIIVE